MQRSRAWLVNTLVRGWIEVGLLAVSLQGHNGGEDQERLGAAETASVYSVKDKGQERLTTAGRRVDQLDAVYGSKFSRLRSR